MATLSHQPSGVAPERRRWSLQLLVPELWASLAIVVMWLSVLFDAVWGPDLVTTTVTTHTTVPSAVLVAPFAFFGTWVVAKYGFGHDRNE
ncbi:MAG TPA: hypothetical protein VLB86_00610 [Gaiellaceae bacterium]|nr:hypothetical protein [Gaiellaceae bacterium]